MIVNYTAEGWEIISQRAHGLLAAQIAHQWRHNIRTERWVETLLAIAEHDDAQVELERDDLLTPQGGPADFKMRRLDLPHCNKTLQGCLSKSTYIALLCSMHLDFLYSGVSSANPEAARFIKQQQAIRTQWRKQLGITAKAAANDYRLLEWCDAFSLLIAQRENQPEARSVEISVGPDGKTHQLAQPSVGTLQVNPWPFENDNFELYYETRILRQLQFKTSAEFRQCYSEAPVIVKRWRVEKG